MLDDKDLQAIAQMLAQQKQELKAELRQEVAQDIKVLFDLEVKPQFNLLAEQVQLLEEKIDGVTPVENVYADIYAMKAAIRTINKEIKALKQAQ